MSLDVDIILSPLATQQLRYPKHDKSQNIIQTRKKIILSNRKLAELRRNKAILPNLKSAEY